MDSATLTNLGVATLILAAATVVFFASLLFIGGVLLLAAGANAWSKSLSASATARAHTAAAEQSEVTSKMVQDAEEEIAERRPTRGPRNVQPDDIMAGILAEREANAFSRNGHADVDTNINEGADISWDARPSGLE